jgi:transposase
MRRTAPEIIEVDEKRFNEMLERAEAGAFTQEDYQTVSKLIQSYAHLTGLIGDKNTSIHRLRKLLFGASTEKTSDVIGQDSNQEQLKPLPAEEEEGSSAEEDPSTKPKGRRKGHGRNGASKYTGAEKIKVPHGSLEAGDSCPECKHGTVYDQANPGVIIRIMGQAPLQAKVYELHKLRCNLCGKIFTAEPPEGIGDKKYDATAASMIALLKYGSGMPFNRLEGLQGGVGVPLAASTQWDIINACGTTIKPAYVELIHQAAQGEVLHNDDTTVKILEFMGKRRKVPLQVQRSDKNAADSSASERVGLFTSGIVSIGEGHTIALFFSGHQHAGENLEDVLAKRAAELAAPIQMCDGLSRNLPAEFETIVANCLAHGRRKFVDVVESFPEECRHVLEALKEVYHNDKLAREQDLTPVARLELHQTQSGPVMESLHRWLTRQFDDHLVEPNSSLGQAINYLLKRWEKLTLFLRVPGAPLDNNICERALKKAILHRKNALFYRSANGAGVGDLFMSLIYTCQLCAANPLDYLTELQRHAEELAAEPQRWMPWNYRETLDGVPIPAEAAC